MQLFVLTNRISFTKTTTHLVSSIDIIYNLSHLTSKHNSSTYYLMNLIILNEFNSWSVFIDNK